jgi:hypothetical protein
VNNSNFRQFCEKVVHDLENDRNEYPEFILDSYHISESKRKYL